MKVRWAGLVLAAASIAALTGCVPEAVGSASTTPSASASAVSTATPSPEASPENPDDPATWIVEGAGIGPLRRTAVFDPSAPAAGPYAVTATNCPNPAVTILEGDGLAKVTVVTEQGGTGIELVEVTNWETSADVVSPSTAEGVRVGASVSELQTAYPGIEQSGVSNNAAVFAVQDEGGWIVFWVMDDLVVKMSASPTSTVPSELCG